MSNYAIFTDSNCDINRDTLAEWKVTCLSLTFRFQDAEKEYTDTDMPITEFYEKMRQGGIAKTAAVNATSFQIAFEEALKQGKDIFYIGFSSGLSTTYNSARIAAMALRNDYPDRKIVTVDSLCASAGQGMAVYLAAKKQQEGASLEENAAYITEMIPAFAHWFTVDDLVYLKRGGRVSPTAAFLGNMLGIKPVLHVDDEGHLIPMTKERGRRKSLQAIADRYTETALDPTAGPVFISHGDCEADARLLADILKQRHGVEVEIITYIGASIGAHSGPGTIALFFLASKR